MGRDGGREGGTEGGREGGRVGGKGGREGRREGRRGGGGENVVKCTKATLVFHPPSEHVLTLPFFTNYSCHTETERMHGPCTQLQQSVQRKC